MNTAAVRLFGPDAACGRVLLRALDGAFVHELRCGLGAGHDGPCHPAPGWVIAHDPTDYQHATRVRVCDPSGDRRDGPRQPHGGKPCPST